MNRLLQLTKRIAKSLLRRVLAFVYRHPRLRSAMLSTIHRMGLNGIARRTYSRLLFTTTQHGTGKHKGLTSPHARQIYQGLQAAIKSKKKKGA